MEHDSSDILGQDTMPVRSGSGRGAFPLSVTQAIVWSSLCLGIYIVGKRLWRRVLQWRERSYKLATRRRHGIPDSDFRPFNVAYSEAMMRAREEESRKQGKPKPALRPQPSLLDHQREPQLDQNLRHRQGVPQRPDPGMRSTVIPVPGDYITGPYEPRLPAQTRNAQDINHLTTNTYHPVQPTTNGFSKPAGLARHGGYLDITDADMSDAEGRKRALDEEQDESEHEAKKSRVEGDELIDGDEDAEFEDLAPKRGSKRGLRDEEDGEDVADASKKARGKRARKVSHEKGPQVDSSMDVDDEEADEITELKSTLRGKKRDRAEAGSTFGGDDEDSGVELEAEGDAKARRQRKRRTVAKRKSEASYIRAKKHGNRDASDSGSEGATHEKQASSHDRKKRGKRHSHIERRASGSDVSMDESTTSNRSKVRNIGDEWESNGVKYKIGLNGQRLRQALVKKARQKFVMPKDSQHPDRDANLQVCVETWLTEEEYQDAKAQHLLAWQDSPPPPRNEDVEKLTLNTSTSESVPFPQGLPGKSLLWSTSTSSTPTASPAHSQSPAAEATSFPDMGPPKHRSYRDTYRHSIATTVGLPISPFITASAAQVPSTKRIASNARAISLSSGSPGLSDSTNGSPRIAQPQRVFSKWEKQELEAKAMMKIREANRRKEAEREMKAKEERERVERERAVSAEKLKVERERLEREKAARVEMERAERDRLAKEAAEKQKAAAAAASAAAVPAPAPLPQITVTAPTATTSSQPSTSSGGGAAVPNFFAPKVERSNSQSPFSYSPSAGAPAPAQAASASSPFLFNPSTPSASAAPTPTTNGTSAAKPGGFPFGPSGGAEAKKDGTGTSGGGSSLLSRMGQQSQIQPEPLKSQTSNQGQPNFAASPGTTTTTTTNPMFSFTKPGGPSPFGQPAASSNTAPAPAGETTSTTPKFNFGNPSKTTGSAAPAKGPELKPFNFQPTTTSGGGPGSSSLSGALGAEQKAGGFKSFGIPASGSGSAGAAGTTASTTPVSAPKFNFAASSSPFGGAGASADAGKEGQKSAFGTTTNGTSAFGNTGTTNAFGNTGAFGNANKPSAFGSTGSSAFGNNGAGNNNATSAFGSGSGPSPFGATTSSAFGGASKPAAPGDSSAPKFSFGNPSTSSTSAGSNAAKTTTFSFGGPQTPASGTPTGTGTAAPLTFKFGDTGAAGGSTTPQSSPFGAAPASAFSGFGGTGGGAFGGGAKQQ
ncbi:hypothetical protein GALMADRAFT_236804 [Galerina marginata CBS 339.88]|uniref:Uncharacterized protein n=1 Tax=Galerina marginata (strain CBS 339.88) TaxID=685588 RepID=A0A067TYJ8_GALM3|nr:hypothetical protein GALMADRAFT_236804 [Galerina marginata CBS 339.88]